MATTEVRIRVSRHKSYATALRGHLSAAMAYINTGDYEDADIELGHAELCLDVLKDYVMTYKEEAR